MNWDAIGAIAELLGAVGVIASLVYLAGQIRQSREQMSQNTRAMRSSAFQQFDQNLNDAFSTLLTVPGMGRVARLGGADYEQLDEDDAFMFSLWLGGILMRIDNGYYQHRAGMLDDESWKMLLRILQAYSQNPEFVKWWRGTPQLYMSPEFVALVDEILGEETGEGSG